jgi:hypothetical protein
MGYSEINIEWDIAGSNGLELHDVSGYSGISWGIVRRHGI